MNNPARDLPKMMESAASLHGAGRLDEAEKLYHQILAHVPHLQTVHYVMAILGMQTQRWQMAFDHIERALKQDLANVNYLFLRGEIFAQLDNKPAAAADLKTALQNGYAAQDAVRRHMGWNRLGSLSRDLGKYEDAIAAWKECHALNPKDRDVCINIGSAVALVESPAAAVPWFRLALKQGEHYQALFLLTDALVKANNKNAALETGSRALELSAQTSMAKYESIKEKIPPLGSPHAAGKKLITFSLWGDKRTYIEGAYANAELAPKIYPGWVCRFYCDERLDLAVTERLKSLGTETVIMPAESKPALGLFWRMYAAYDQGVSHFLCRDCDSRLNLQEADAVEEWLESGKDFHIMRDHPSHVVLILAGMWGGKAGVLPDIRQLMQIAGFDADSRFADQEFLSDIVWPMIHGRALTHDSYYDFDGGKPFPQQHRLTWPDHIGACHKFD